MTDCIFCKIVAGKIPAEIIWEDEKHIAILDIFPNTDGFTVVLTKEHRPSNAFKNDDATLSNLVIATKKVANILEKAFDDVDRCGMFFEGLGVNHLHSKISPMHVKDVRGSMEVGEGKFYKKYPGFLTSQSSYRADDKQLKQLAVKIKSVLK